MKYLTALLLAFSLMGASAQELDPLVDYRYAGVVIRDVDGKTLRSTEVIATFKAKYACPASKKHYGACPGWAIDHVIPLACGGVDAIYNMQWLPDQIKSASGIYSKDRFERKVYGGNSMGTGCP